MGDNTLKKRIEWIDFGKGITMFFVVFGHVLKGIYETGNYSKYNFFLEIMLMVIFTFVMPVFFAISGFLFKKVTTLEIFCKGMRKKFVALFVPYLFFSIVYVGLQSFSSDINTRYTFNSVLNIYRTPISYLWYLYVLFFIFLMVSVMDLVIKSNKYELLITVACFVFILIHPTNIYIIDNTIRWMFPFMVGRNYSMLIGMIKNSKITISILGIIFIFVLSLQMMYIKKFYASNGMTLGTVVSKTISIPLFFMVISRIRITKKFNYVESIGKYSLIYYLVHVPVASIVRIMLMKFGIGNFYLQIVGGLSITLLVCYTAAYLAKKVKLIDLLFYPTKYLI